MSLFKNKYRVESVRLNAIDYGSSNSYIITICVADRQPSFGQVIQISNPSHHPFRVLPPYLENPTFETEPRSIAALQFTRMGQAAYEFWLRIPQFHSYVDLDAFVIMPDHVHGILHFTKDEVGTGLNRFGPQERNLASVVRGYKSGLTMLSKELQIPFKWQTRYYDTVIRNGDHLAEAQAYILSNPERHILKRSIL